MQFAGPDERHHERVLLGLMDEDENEWVTLTVDRRIFQVNFPQLRDLQYLHVDRQLPRGLVRANVRMVEDGPHGDLTLREFVDFMEQGVVIMNNAKLKRGLPIVAVVDKQSVWVVAEVGANFGQDVTPPDHEIPARGDRALHYFDDGSCVMLEKIDPQDKENWRQQRIKEYKEKLLDLTKEDDPEDIRVCKVRYEAHSGERWRTFKEGVALLNIEDFEDFPVDGPRSFLWLVKELAKGDSNPQRQFSDWLVKSKIPDNDRVRYEAEVLTDC